MKKGQKLSNATTRSQQLQVRKVIKEQAKKERQRIRESAKPRKPSNSTTRRTASRSSNKYTYRPSSPDIFDKMLEGIWDFIFNIVQKISQKIFS
jgi:hypothetical protein